MRQRQFSRGSDDGRDAVSLLKSLIEQLLPGLTSRAENSDPHDLSGQNLPDKTRECVKLQLPLHSHTRLCNTPEKGLKIRIGILTGIRLMKKLVLMSYLLLVI